MKRIARALSLFTVAATASLALACEEHVPAYALVEGGQDAAEAAADAGSEASTDAPAEGSAADGGDGAASGDAAAPIEAGADAPDGAAEAARD